MAPANQVLVLSPPGSALVLRVADDAGCAKFLYSQFLHASRLSGSENDFSANIFACVVALCRTIAYVHQVGR